MCLGVGVPKAEPEVGVLVVLRRWERGKQEGQETELDRRWSRWGRALPGPTGSSGV